MSITFACECGRLLRVSTRLAAKRIRCPKCHAGVRVPLTSEPHESGSSGVLRISSPELPPPLPGSPPPRPSRVDGGGKQRQPTTPPPRDPAAPIKNRAPVAPNSTEVLAKRDAKEVPAPPPISTLADSVVGSAPRSDPAPAPPPRDAPARKHLVSAEAAEQDQRGVEHEWARRVNVYYLAVAVALFAIFGTIPSILDMMDHFAHEASPGIARWAYLLLVIGIVQVAYVVYMIQLPDWTSVWVITLLLLATSVLYAVVLGTTMMSRVDNPFIEALGLTGSDKAPGWCFIMVLLASSLAYFSGRMSVRWRRIEDQYLAKA